MITKLLAGGALAATLLVVAPRPQTTPPAMAATYDSLADAILAIKSTEANFVHSLLDGHYHAAAAYAGREDFQKAAAEMALFANEGDNTIGGVRKRLVEGGHHHNAEGEAKGIYEPGYVVVTSEAKKKILELSRAMRQTDDDAKRQAIWKQFSDIAAKLLAG